MNYLNLFELANSSLTYSNFSKLEWQSVRSLSDDRSIVIKKADKGSCVVVWDREDYIKEAYSQLNDSNTYREIVFKEDILKELAETSNKIFLDLKR